MNVTFVEKQIKIPCLHAGDKGQGSFKFNMQVVNTLFPNAVKNTVLLAVFKAGDSRGNSKFAHSSESVPGKSERTAGNEVEVVLF